MSTVNVSEHALVQRINRKLKHQNERLRRLRGAGNWPPPRGYHDLGEYYVVDDCNCVTATHCDLEILARDLGAMHERETVAA
jgi:hypothetical protein